MTEQLTQSDEKETPADDDAVEEFTHTTRQGQDEASRHADVLAEQDAERYGLRELDLRAAAYASVFEDWTEYGKVRLPQICFEARVEPANEVERRFLRTVEIRERTICWKQGESS